MALAQAASASRKLVAKNFREVHQCCPICAGKTAGYRPFSNLNRWVEDLAGFHIPDIEYLRETDSEGVEMIMWLIMRGAMGRKTTAVHGHYHVPGLKFSILPERDQRLAINVG